MSFSVHQHSESARLVPPHHIFSSSVTVKMAVPREIFLIHQLIYFSPQYPRLKAHKTCHQVKE